MGNEGKENRKLSCGEAGPGCCTENWRSRLFGQSEASTFQEMNLAIPLDRAEVNVTEGPSALSAESFFNDRLHRPLSLDKGDVTVDNERPEHITIARYLALGLSQSEAAKATGYSQQQVSRLLKMPWFQERVAQFLSEGSQDLMTLFKGAALSAFATLIEITENPKMPPAVRLAGVKEILERNLGKATQYLEVKQTSSADPVAEVEALEKELAARRLNE